MTDRRVADASPAELAEAFLQRMGWSVGTWAVELHAVDGVVRKVTAKSSGGREVLLAEPARLDSA